MPKLIIATTTAHPVPKYPAWYTLPQQPIKSIEADGRIECDIDVNGIGRIRVRPGYNVNVEDIRYIY